MTTSDLSYPVIGFHERGIIQVYVDEDALTTGTARFLKGGWFKGITLVDSQGRSVHVKDAVFVSGKGRFWGFTPLLNRIVKTSLQLEEPSKQLSLDDVKSKVLRSMKKDLNSVCNPEDVLDNMRKVKQAGSMSELLGLIAEDYDSRRLIDLLRKL